MEMGLQLHNRETVRHGPPPGRLVQIFRSLPGQTGYTDAEYQPVFRKETFVQCDNITEMRSYLRYNTAIKGGIWYEAER